VLNNIKHICVTDDTRKNLEYNLKDDYKEVWFIKDDLGEHKYPYRKGDIIAAINKYDEFIVIDEFKDIIEKFIRIEQRKKKLERINDSI